MLKGWIEGEEVLVRPEWMFICLCARGGMKEQILVTCGGEPLMLKNRQQLWKDSFLIFEYTLAQMFHRAFLSVLTGSVWSERTNAFSRSAYVSFSFPQCSYV